MKNPCNNCKIRWLCKPYVGKCWLKKLYIRRISRRIANDTADDLQRHCNEIIEKLRREILDGN